MNLMTKFNANAEVFKSPRAYWPCLGALMLRAHPAAFLGIPKRWRSKSEVNVFSTSTAYIVSLYRERLAGMMLYSAIWSVLLFVLLMAVCITTLAQSSADGDAPPSRINTVEIAWLTAKHMLDYSHFKVIGVCLWVSCDPDCHTKTTLELDEYLPDLIVMAYNGYGNNPWLEVNDSLDIIAHASANRIVKSVTGYALGNGKLSAQFTGLHADHIHAKSVDIIGNPNPVLGLPYVHLNLDTQIGRPYFQSELDALIDRSNLAESTRPETYNPFSHFIGHSYANHWSYEFPRSMLVNVDNDYKASVIAALHAADIVTNRNTLHVVQSTDNSCGKSCAVASIIEELDEQHAIWQEVYPNDRHIHIGEDDSTSVSSLGNSDEQKGHGNYVFALWRHYRGCIQTDGEFMMASQHINETKKR